MSRPARTLTATLGGIASIPLIWLSGCAGYTVQQESFQSTTGANGQVSTSWVSSGKQGYYVYQPKPYILQTPILDKNGAHTGYEYSLVYLPDRSVRYRIDTHNFLAKSDISFAFNNGWMLTNVADKSDNTGIATEVIKAATALIPRIGAESIGAGTPVTDPILYEIEFDPVSGRVTKVIRLKPVEP